jgi:hypothetical protein
VVERVIGNDEVLSSILSGGTSLAEAELLTFFIAHSFPRQGALL